MQIRVAPPDVDVLLDVAVTTGAVEVLLVVVTSPVAVRRQDVVVVLVGCAPRFIPAIKSRDSKQSRWTKAMVSVAAMRNFWGHRRDK